MNASGQNNYRGLQPAGRAALVLGGSGFIGSALRRRLAKEESAVTVLSRNPASTSMAFSDENWIHGDFGDTNLVSSLLTPGINVYHLISSSSPAVGNWDVEIDIRDTVLPTLRLLKAAVEARVGKMIYVSSGGTIYGNPGVLPIPETAPTEPISAYGVGKLTIEKYLLLFAIHHGLDSRILRVANPYGPGQNPKGKQGVVANLIGQGLSGEPFQIWGDGSVARDFVHVDDVALALSMVSRYDGPMRVFNVGSGQARQIAAIARDVEVTLGLTSHPRLHHESRGFDVPVNYLDIARIGEEVRWAPQTPWMSGLAQTADWIRNLDGQGQ